VLAADEMPDGLGHDDVRGKPFLLPALPLIPNRNFPAA
jgi:hypothetical protein